MSDSLASYGTRRVLQELTFIDRFARDAVRRFGRFIEQDEIRLVEDGQTTAFQGRPGLTATIHVLDPRFYRCFLFGGSVGAAEAYMEGFWNCDDLTTLMRILVRNSQAFTAVDSGISRLTFPLRKLAHWLNSNTRTGSRRNIAAHYDLGNAFFEAFLDETMTYSCGVFATPESTMAEASREKLDRLCRLLQLQPDDHLLEIGSGWGSMAMHAASQYGCKVTTTTISRAQHALATRRIAEAGLSDRITVLFKDYRDLEGAYDKIVSVEMIEAVGWEYYPTFFAKCSGLLKPGGLLALQAITVHDQYYETQKRDVDFIKRYIFPGGCLPSVTALCDAATRASDLTLYQLDDIGVHYVRTLLEWRRKFFTNIDQIRALKNDESFLRMWDYYLCYCAGAFAERHVSTVHMLYARRDARPDDKLLCFPAHDKECTR